MEENMVENMDIEEQAEKKDTKEKAIGSIGNVKVTGNLVTTRMVDGRTITESFEEIDAKNKIHFQNAQEAAARIIAESERHRKATAERLAREAAEQNK